MRISWICMALISFVLATGCGAQMSDFVHGVKKDQPASAIPPVPGSPVQLSAASSLVASTRYEGRVTLTTSQKPLQGTRFDARVSLHQGRGQ